MKQYQTVPGFIIKVGGTTFDSNNPNGLVSVNIEDNVDMASTCQIVVEMKGSTQASSFSAGDAVSVCLRSDNEIFSGDVTHV
jgi:hypothetical protein